MLNKELLASLAELDHATLLEENPSLYESEEELAKIKSLFHSMWHYSKLKKMREEYGQRDSDVYVVTYSKSGTTLTQMILYQMTTDGSMDFKHLYEVSPWLSWDVSHRTKPVEINSRRIIKSHDGYNAMKNLKGKFVFVIRDALDVMASSFQHCRDYLNIPDDFDKHSEIGLERWFKYNTQWLKNDNELDILYLTYEDLVKDKEKSVKKMADFLEIELTEAVLKRILERSSFAFMKQHESKFGVQPPEWKVYDNFIRKGIVGEGRQRFTEERLEKYQEKAQEFMAEHELTKRYF